MVPSIERQAGGPVAFEAPFTDPGSNDTHSCTVDFDDGTPVQAGSVDQSAGSGTCTINHEFTARGPHHVLVTVTDDDGDSGTAVVTVVVHLRAEAFAISANGPVTILKTPHATCPPDESLTLAALTTGLVNLDALNAECTVDPDTGATVASASVDEASLLGGVINITNIQSTCQAGADGITRTLPCRHHQRDRHRDRLRLRCRSRWWPPSTSTRPLPTPRVS